MSTASPSAFLLWAVLAVIFLVFMTHHLWCYDRFACLRWNSGRQPGAFKRIMTYSYLASVPLTVIFSIMMTFVKYQEGWLLLPDGKLIPKPVDLYSDRYHNWLLPLYFVFSAAWALELITHLEELAFWLFMLHQSPGKGQWFNSWEYRFWYLGSMVAILGLPITATVTRYDIMTCDAWIILVGSSGATSTTLAFLYVLWNFPNLLRHVKSEGADPNVVVQLHTFFHLNLTRIVFRLLFTLPLLVLSIDALVGDHHPINRHVFLSDFLFMVGGFGCFFSSGMTLLIFFPRSLTIEAGYTAKIATPPPSGAQQTPPTSPKNLSVDFGQYQRNELSTRPVSESDFSGYASTRIRGFRSLDLEIGDDVSDAPPYHRYEMNEPHALARSRSIPLAHLRRMPSLHPYVATFTSPIDLVDIPPAPPDEWPRAI